MNLNIKYSEFLGLNTDQSTWVMLFKSIIKKDNISGYPVRSWQVVAWKDILSLKTEKEPFKQLAIWQAWDIEKLNDYSVLELVAGIKYMQSEVEAMATFVNGQLKDTTTVIEQNAGIDELIPFSDLSLAERICKDWNLKINEVWDIAYGEIITKRIYESKKTIYEQRLNKLIQRQRK